jgi:dihydroorotate dehydrogenase
MSWFYRQFVRPALFTQNAEQIHNWTLRALGWTGRHGTASHLLAAFFQAPKLPAEVFGLKFPNPVGLAAGMDKEAAALPAWDALGFGFTELGAVTWLAQPGNPPPRVFRAIAEDAIVNRMGFNNPGAEAVAQALASWRAKGRWPNHPVGMNLGKSKVTPLAKAAEDYAASLRVLRDHVDFFVVNVSSPNTPDLRRLQDKEALADILAALGEVQAETRKPPRPVLVKVAPDLSFEALDEIVALAAGGRIAGLVATNTTIERPQTADPRLARVYAEAGGLSGRPLRARSTEVVRHLFRQTKGTLPIIGVGGIFNAADAWEKLTAGASLIQIYTGLVFEGPGTPKAIVAGLAKRLSAAGLTSLRQAVGLEAFHP